MRRRRACGDGRSPRLGFGAMALVLCVAHPAPAQDGRLTGFPGETAATKRALESRFAATLDASHLRSWLRHLSARPRHTGSPGSRRVAEFLAQEFRKWGFEAEIETFFALMPTPSERLVEMVSPRHYRASLREPAIPGYTPPDTDASLPPYNTYSRDGDVTAEAVYVNYGLAEDYAVLERHGIDVRGKIGIARYGQVFRGIKPRLAGEKGAIGVILFSDPAESGSARGAVYPDGPFLPDDGYQRGSVMDITRFTGDPLTPGEGVRRRPESFSVEDALPVISPVPVQPLSAKDIEPILAAMTGPVTPTAWQGALPLTYRFGGNVEVRLKVIQDWAIVPLHNVVARIEGSTWPDEWVLRGNNHDAWNYGALVPLSGLITMMEEARSIGRLLDSQLTRPFAAKHREVNVLEGRLLRGGWRPKRSLVYLAWDGQEQGLLGSTEWAETYAAELPEKAVAYLNTGVTTRGLFAAGGSHALETLVNEVARVVNDPTFDVPVHDRVTAAVRVDGDDEQRRDLDATGRLRLSALGLGSDFTPFLQHLGIASLDYAFDGEAESGVYHSRYDTFDFFDRFVDPDYTYGVTLAEASGRTVLRLANADVLPFDFTGMSQAITRYLREIETLFERDESPTAPLDVTPLARAVDQLTASAQRFSSARDAFAASEPSVAPQDLERLNRNLRRTEQSLAPEAGLPRRPWYRYHIYAPGHDTGYSVKTIPSLREAVERQDWAQAEVEITSVAEVIGQYARAIDDCTQILDTSTSGE